MLELCARRTGRSSISQSMTVNPPNPQAKMASGNQMSLAKTRAMIRQMPPPPVITAVAANRPAAKRPCSGELGLIGRSAIVGPMDAKRSEISQMRRADCLAKTESAEHVMLEDIEVEHEYCQAQHEGHAEIRRRDLHPLAGTFAGNPLP